MYSYGTIVSFDAGLDARQVCFRKFWLKVPYSWYIYGVVSRESIVLYAVLPLVVISGRAGALKRGTRARRYIIWGFRMQTMLKRRLERFPGVHNRWVRRLGHPWALRSRATDCQPLIVRWCCFPRCLQKIKINIYVGFNSWTRGTGSQWDSSSVYSWYAETIFCLGQLRQLKI